MAEQEIEHVQGEELTQEEPSEDTVDIGGANDSASTDDHTAGTREEFWKKQSREWERKAKASRKDAEKAADLEAAKSEMESKLEQQTQALEQANKELETLKAANAVSEEKGVPVSLLKGETREEMEASADDILKFVAAQKPKFPEDKGGSAGSSKSNVSSIKDPVARIKARAEQIQSQS